MKKVKRPDRETISSRIYSRLILLYPKDFQEEFGAEMDEAFRDALRGTTSLFRILELWRRTLIDVLLSAPAEHILHARSRRSTGQEGRKFREGLMRSMLQDIRYSWRSLAKNRAMALVFILTISVGIGANASVFSIVNSIMLRPLPVPDPEQLTVVAMVRNRASFPGEISYPDYLDYRENVSEFSDLAIYDLDSVGLGTGREAVRAMVNYVSTNMFTMLGVQPGHGRLLLPRDGDERASQPVLVLGHSFWKRHFGSDPGVVGRKVVINGDPVTVIGVVPEGFYGVYSLLEMDAYLPIGLMLQKSDGRWKERDNRFLTAIGRLKPGAGLRQARASLDVVSDRLALEYPETNKEMRAVAYPETRCRPTASVAEFLPVVSTVFLALVLLVLFVASANGLNLLLAHATVRQQSMAVKAAFGARRSRLVRQFLIETLMMSLLGGVGGLLMGSLMARFLERLDFATDLPLRLNFGLDWRVCVYVIGLSLATGLLVGLLPAFRVSGGDLHRILRAQGRSGGAAQGHLMRHVLVVAQVAVSVMLLVAAGLFVRSLQHAREMDPGFDPGGVLNLTMDPGQHGYDDERTNAFYRDLLDRVRVLPGVASVSMAYSSPMGYVTREGEVVAEGQPVQPDDAAIRAGHNIVAPDYFETLRIRILKGRAIGRQDRADSRPVAVVSESLAERLWPGQNPIGQRFGYKGQDGLFAEVVGVAGDGIYQFLLEKELSYFFVPLAQDFESLRTLHVRTRSEAPGNAREVRRLVRESDAGLPVFDVQTMERSLQGANGFFLLNLGAGMGAAAGCLGLLLAAIGVFGVVSYVSSQRTHEIGVRIALGAQRNDVLRLVSRQGLGLVFLGTVIGLAGALGLGQVISSLLFGVDPTDLTTFLVVAVVLAAVGLMAALLPARRASRVDPVVALRYD